MKYAMPVSGARLKVVVITARNGSSYGTIAEAAEQLAAVRLAAVRLAAVRHGPEIYRREDTRHPSVTPLHQRGVFLL
jgi:hypothetical protein